MRICEIDGTQIKTEEDFHQAISAALDFGDNYGRNLDALWDRLSADLERPVTVVWKNAAEARKCLGERFHKIVEIFQRVRAQDERFGWAHKFEYRLE